MMLDKSSVSHNYSQLPPTPALVSTSTTNNNHAGLSRKPSKYQNLPPPSNLIIAHQPVLHQGLQPTIHQPQTFSSASTSPPNTSPFLQPLTNGNKNLLQKRGSNQLFPNPLTENKSTGNLFRSISPTPQTKNFISTNAHPLPTNNATNKTLSNDVK